jgi:hypothetical protein
MSGMLTVRTVRVVSTCVTAGGRADTKETVMKAASKWGTAVLMAGALAAGLIMSSASAGATANQVTAADGRGAGQAVGIHRSARVSGPSCASAAMCLAVVSFTQGNPNRPIVLGEVWNGTSWTAEPIPVPTGERARAKF